MDTPLCPYCNKPSVLVTGKRVYKSRKDLWDKHFYLCEKCFAFVGCHGVSTNPLGSLANSKLRKDRSKAHSAFDPLWRGKAPGTRKKTYQWLADSLGIPVDQCHIAMFTSEQCAKVVSLCNSIDTFTLDLK